jgi:hypothetical protein
MPKRDFLEKLNSMINARKESGGDKDTMQEAFEAVFGQTKDKRPEDTSPITPEDMLITINMLRDMLVVPIETFAKTYLDILTVHAELHTAPVNYVHIHEHVVQVGLTVGDLGILRFGEEKFGAFLENLKADAEAKFNAHLADNIDAKSGLQSFRPKKKAN